jgi:4-alpha-glucanotransferase
LGQLPGYEDLSAEKRIHLHIDPNGNPKTEVEQHHFNYLRVLEMKLEALKSIYTDLGGAETMRPSLEKWIGNNPWITYFAVFSSLKERHHRKAWTEWGEFQYPSRQDIEQYWKKHPEETYFFAWVQFHLEKQLKRAAEDLYGMGIALKGDLPILMNHDSAEVWYHRNFFNTGLRAGAPPDMFSDAGQNWDFPIYDWNALEEDDYSWWKDRLRQAAKFYSAYRIDHVLGFFRIWCIPGTHYSGSLGFYDPYVFASEEEIRELGFEEGRIRWMKEPHVSEHQVDGAFPDLSERGRVKEHYLVRIGEEPLFLLDRGISGEKAVERMQEPESVKQWFRKWIHDRMLLEPVEGGFALYWHYQRSQAYRSLSEEEKSALKALFQEKDRLSEDLWEERGRKLLRFMKDTTEMLVCAEDLGVVPKCVPRVLKELSILSLKIPRWSKEYDQEEEPYIPPREYPFESVCAPSVHDTSTLRGWWDRETDPEEREAFLVALGFDEEEVLGMKEESYSPGIAQKLLTALQGAASRLVIYQLQDLLQLSPEYYTLDPEEERINVPGTLSDANWTYRIPLNLGELKNDTALCASIRAIVDVREALERKFYG